MLNRILKIITGLALISGVFSAALAQPDDVTPMHVIDQTENKTWDIAEGNPPVFDPAYLNGSTYSEGWDFVFHFDNGIVVGAQMAVSNFGKGKHRLLVLVKLTTPEGEEMTLKNGRARKDWFRHEGEFDYEIARHHVWKDGGVFHFRFVHPSGDISIEAEPVTEAMDLGLVWQGRNDHYQYVNIFAPRLKAAGRYRVRDEDGNEGEWQELGSGTGHGLRHVTSSAMGEASRIWLRGFASGESAMSDMAPVIDLRQLKSGDTAGTIRLLDDKGNPVADFELQTDQSLLEQGRESCCTMIPVEARGVQEGTDIPYKLEGQIRLLEQVQKFDVVDELKPFERFFVRMFRTPVNTRYILEYDLSFTSGEESRIVQGRGLADLMTLE